MELIEVLNQYNDSYIQNCNYFEIAQIDEFINITIKKLRTYKRESPTIENDINFKECAILSDTLRYRIECEMVRRAELN